MRLIIKNKHRKRKLKKRKGKTFKKQRLNMITYHLVIHENLYCLQILPNVKLSKLFDTVNTVKYNAQGFTMKQNSHQKNSLIKLIYLSSSGGSSFSSFIIFMMVIQVQ